MAPIHGIQICAVARITCARQFPGEIAPVVLYNTITGVAAAMAGGEHCEKFELGISELLVRLDI